MNNHHLFPHGFIPKIHGKTPQFHAAFYLQAEAKKKVVMSKAKAAPSSAPSPQALLCGAQSGGGDGLV